jgi:hypothetical protein
MSNCRTVVILSAAEAFARSERLGTQVTAAELARLSDVVGRLDAGTAAGGYADCLLADGTLVTCTRSDRSAAVMMMVLPPARPSTSTSTSPRHDRGLTVAH